MARECQRIAAASFASRFQTADFSQKDIDFDLRACYDNASLAQD